MNDIDDLFGRRCGDYDPDCATCFAYKQQDEIEKLRAALKPFADRYAYTRKYCPDRGHMPIGIDDLRAAATALKETGDE